MRFEMLLALFDCFNRQAVDYTVVGSLALAIHGHPALSENLEIVIDEQSSAQRVREILHTVWPSAELVPTPGQDILMRALLESSPLYCDFLVSLDSLPAQFVYFGGVAVRVLPFSDAQRWHEREPLWVRPGFTFRQRLEAVNVLASILAAPLDTPRGVRKFRSFEALKAERARIRATRAVQ